jgi:hypothetical protein
MKKVLEHIFLMSSWSRFIGLRPEVLTVVATPELQRNKMVHFAADSFPMFHAISGIHLLLR